MKTVEATYRIVTPMFMGGANQDPSDGIRPPSFKGALRFWWRALNWSKFLEDASNDEVAALKALHQKEADLFGSAAKDGQGGQGCFLLEVSKQPNTSENNLVSDWPNGHTERGSNSKSGYLGLGLFPMGEHKRRKAIAENQLFTVVLRWTPKASEEDKKYVLKSMKAIGVFGGLGSRNRKAFGSISIEKLGDDVLKCQNKGDYEKLCKSLLQTSTQMLPPYTALSRSMRLALSHEASDARAAHSALANTYWNTRGQGGDVKGRDKIAFGLPLSGYDEARRASPVFMHIHPIGQGFISSCLFLPAEFHPNYEQGGSMNFYKGVSSFMDKLQEVSL